MGAKAFWAEANPSQSHNAPLSGREVEAEAGTGCCSIYGRYLGFSRETVFYNPGMRFLLPILLLSAPFAFAQPETKFDQAAAERFAALALKCVHQEYPNKIAHTMNSDADVAPPRKLTPSFYGCYDWHSAVHGHWLLARLAREYPQAPFAAPARAALKRSLTRENIAVEVAYLNAAGRASFERPYGLAWLLQLAAELREWGEPKPTTEAQRHGEKQEGKRATPTPTTKADDAEAAELAAILRPLEDAAVARLKAWLPKLSHAVRSGEHSQSAFALGLMIDYARTVDDTEFEKLLVGKARKFYLYDKECPLKYEPSGEDFLSPCLAEADVMRRVLLKAEYATWLRGFLPVLWQAEPKTGVLPKPWLAPEVVTDPSDPKLAHLDGLNLSRAWMLEGMASGLDVAALRPLEQARLSPRNTPAMWRLQGAAKVHREAGLASVTGAHYEGGHWLGSFAVYLVTRRGIAQ